jgi:hypothetical protein
MAAVTDATAQGSKYITSFTANAGTATLGFEAQGGAYVIWARVVGASATSDSFVVAMDGTEDVFDIAEGSWSPSWQWVRVNGRAGGAPLQLDPRQFTLAVGAHTLSFTGREAGARLDAVIITSDITFVPTDAPPACGDGACDGTEACSSCESDCGACPSTCGDASCDAAEDCNTCASDCGVCPPRCGDAACNGAETCSSCASDCGTCPTTPTGVFAATNGSAGGQGTQASPWSLAYALSGAGGRVTPGTTVWVRGGRYVGSFTSALVGTATAPIVVRQYPGERVTLDANGASGDRPLTIGGAYTHYVDFEVTHSGTSRSDSGGANGPDGIYVGPSNHIKLINLVIHDMPGQGIASYAPNSESEFYGNLIYYNGTNNFDHGVYAQNGDGQKRLVDNVVFHQSGWGLHLYGSDTARLDNFTVEGNIVFENGSVRNTRTTNILLGGGQAAHSPVLRANYVYHSPAFGDGTSLDFGYMAWGAGCDNGTVVDGYYVSPYKALTYKGTNTTMTGNTFYGPVLGTSAGQFPNNTFTTTRPSTNKVFMRKNQYEAGRANIVVFNWQLLDSVSVDVSSVLAVGDAYEVRNVQNFSGTPVLTGTYSGGPVSLPMTNLVSAKPANSAFPTPSTGKEFNAFVLRRR